MAFNGSGVFSRIYSWVTEAANNEDIEAVKFDAEMDDMANGLSNCITRDGQSTVIADISLSNKRITNLGTPTANADAATKSYVDGVASRELDSPTSTTSGASVTFPDIPSTAKRVTLLFRGVSSNGTSHLRMLLGTSGGLESSGYVADCMQVTSSGTTNRNSTAQFVLSEDNAPGRLYSGRVTLTLQEAATNTWVLDSHLGRGSDGAFLAMGYKALAGPLTSLYLTFGGTDTFDAGNISRLVE